ncbi:hypothetical protein L0F63_000133 [Massospora cicadina]|nr:hypothetical protein L0F63_000133 [Massospora cicadina]
MVTAVDPSLLNMAYPYMDLASLEAYVNDTTLGAQSKPALIDFQPSKCTTQDINLPALPSTPFPHFTTPQLGKDYPTHTCPEPSCQREFKRLEHLKRHIQSIHSNYKPYHCHFQGCDRRFSRSDNLNQHLKIHNLNPPPQ